MNQPTAMHLVAISGPQMPALVLQPKPQGISLGRSAQCDLSLPGEHAERVSRLHARFSVDHRGWRLVDLNSRWGTHVNGTRLPAGAEVSLEEGDLIHVSPWTFLFTASTHPRGLRAADDFGQTHVRMLDSAAPAPHLPEERLALLLKCAAAMHAAQTEKELGELVVDAAMRGTGLSNAVMLRPVDAMGHLEVIAAKCAAQAQDQPPTFSRSLINASLTGQVAEMTVDATGDWSQSIIEMQITQALCIPLMLNASPAALLYLDQRRSRGAARVEGHHAATSFCVALGQMASLALSSIKRVEMERRQDRIDAELRAAAEAQRWILPPRQTRIHGATIVGESRPGQFVGGDFFDIVDVRGGKVALAVGDVSGHGVAASVLMTSAQGFLHATLLREPDVARAATLLNEFVCPRHDDCTFVTLWLGIFDLTTHELAYVDAGHGYALLQRGDGAFESLDSGDNIPIGVDQAAEYGSATVRLDPGGAVFVVSDGIIEQPAISDAAIERFGLPRLKTVLTAPSEAGDTIAHVFAALERHASGNQFSDDATAVMVHW